MMAKSAGLLRIVAGIGAAAAAVALSRESSRNKLKAEYNKYKENPEVYKQNAKGLVNDISSKANETIQNVKNDPQGYANRLKNDPKSLLQDEKSKFTNVNTKKNDTHELAEGKFDDEGGATVNNNLRVVTEEDLKNNHNALDDRH